MSYKSALEIYYQDLNNLVKLLDIYVSNYKILVSTLNDVNLNVLISRGKKRKAICQVEKLGCIIDSVLDAIFESQKCYLKYVSLKCGVLHEIIRCDFIRFEIEQEILSDLSDDCKNKILNLRSQKQNNSKNN